MRKIIGTLLIVAAVSHSGFSQGLIQQAASQSAAQTVGLPTNICASHEFMKDMDDRTPGYMELANEMLENVKEKQTHGKKAGYELVRIPVVFHVVYNNQEDNVPDSVIDDQLRILNECFRRRNADTSDMRSAFLDIVGDTKIEFVKPDLDPTGQPTNGITRTQTSIEQFGGVLPFGPGQTAQINKWVADSLYTNFFRISEDAQGGKSPWDPSRYMNVWIGDMRIFEPQFNNFLEITFVGLSTPPLDHENWPSDVINLIKDFNQGILLHNVVVGSNNPVKFKGNYSAFNGKINTGKMMVHEAGHYLGLRHIWGDGDCSADDYVDDTPKSNASSQYTCVIKNSCTDDINGVDLPDMIESYMDYSSGTCQNSFTNGQTDVMRDVITRFRSPLVSVFSPETRFVVNVYPNPGMGVFTVDLMKLPNNGTIQVFDCQGKQIHSEKFNNASQLKVNLVGQHGMYFAHLKFSNGTSAFAKLQKI